LAANVVRDGSSNAVNFIEASRKERNSTGAGGEALQRVGS
jgi:hypothetical protein